MSVPVPPVPIRESVLDDLCSRFLINIPEEEKNDPIKLCYHIELAYWFYLDLNRTDDSSLPACDFKEFIATVFRHIPSLAVRDRTVCQLAEEYKSSKHKRPVCGGIILNEKMDKCLLVQSYKSSTWGFPKGKKEAGETDEESAIREVYEEVGLDVRRKINKDWVIGRDLLGHSNRMYIITGISEGTTFETRTRKEIEKIQWFDISCLPQTHKDNITRQKLGKNPNSFYLTVPFIKPLREWIEKKRAGLRVPESFKPVRSSSPRSHSPRKKRSSSGQRGVSGPHSSSYTKRGPPSEPSTSLSPNVQQLFSATKMGQLRDKPLTEQRRPSSPSTEVKSLLNLLKQDQQTSDSPHPVYFPTALEPTTLNQQQQQQQQQHVGIGRLTPGSAYQAPLLSASPPRRRKKTKIPTTTAAVEGVSQVDQQFKLSHFTYKSPALQNFKFNMETIMAPFSSTMFHAST